jgi:hypothetical protein
MAVRYARATGRALVIDWRDAKFQRDAGDGSIVGLSGSWGYPIVGWFSWKILSKKNEGWIAGWFI